MRIMMLKLQRAPKQRKDIPAPNNKVTIAVALIQFIFYFCILLAAK
jgi:hypothetical protein